MPINEVPFMYSWEGPLEEEMATHSNIFAQRIPWTEKPGGLQPWGCKESDTTEGLILIYLSTSTKIKSCPAAAADLQLPMKGVQGGEQK